jgi:RimJ/RimL family protein N-acetyltransferase
MLMHDQAPRAASDVIRLRPIRPDDAPGLIDFHRHLSPQSVYRRFFFTHPTLSPAEIKRFTCVDHIDRLALVDEEGGRLIAVGRYDRIPGTGQAEVAFVVADAHHRQGIATALLDALAVAAGHHGITTFVASVLAENRDMMDVFAHSGFPMATSREDGVVSVRLSLSQRHPPADLGTAAGAGQHGARTSQGLGALGHVS